LNRVCRAVITGWASAGLGKSLRANGEIAGGLIFAYPVSNPRSYGVIEFDDTMKAISIEEKPEHPKSNDAVLDLYFLDKSVIGIAKRIEPSARGELEMTTVDERYLEAGNLQVQVLDRGVVWLDIGTFDSVRQVSEYARVIEDRQGFMVVYIQEIAWRAGWIDDAQLAGPLAKSGYGKYREALLSGEALSG
jgi:glucose-1-phosphate thymidylyltransferase